MTEEILDKLKMKTPEQTLAEFNNHIDKGCLADARKIVGEDLDLFERALKALIREDKTHAIADKLIGDAKEACYALGGENDK